MFFCSTCVPNLDEALEFLTTTKPTPDLNNDLPDKQNQLESQPSLKLLELCLQLSDMFSSSSTSTTKPPSLIANTVVTALNEEREVSLIVHNLTVSNAT